jgi:hypothetical protein
MTYNINTVEKTIEIIGEYSVKELLSLLNSLTESKIIDEEYKVKAELISYPYYPIIYPVQPQYPYYPTYRIEWNPYKL